MQENFVFSSNKEHDISFEISLLIRRGYTIQHQSIVVNDGVFHAFIIAEKYSTIGAH